MNDTMKARISHLHKTEAEWSSLKAWKPSAGEFVIYDPDEQYQYARIKIGDGVTQLSDLPFFIDSAIMANLQNQHYFEVIDGGRITDNTFTN